LYSIPTTANDQLPDWPKLKKTHLRGVRHRKNLGAHNYTEVYNAFSLRTLTAIVVKAIGESEQRSGEPQKLWSYLVENRLPWTGVVALKGTLKVTQTFMVQVFFTRVFPSSFEGKAARRQPLKEEGSRKLRRYYQQWRHEGNRD
jgi:hypothetical protein